MSEQMELYGAHTGELFRKRWCGVVRSDDSSSSPFILFIFSSCDNDNTRNHLAYSKRPNDNDYAFLFLVVFGFIYHH